MDAGALPVIVREGTVTNLGARPGEEPTYVTIRTAEGEASTYEVPLGRAAERLLGRAARITLVLHPAKPGRGEAIPIPILLFRLDPDPALSPGRAPGFPAGQGARRRRPPRETTL